MQHSTYCWKILLYPYWCIITTYALLPTTHAWFLFQQVWQCGQCASNLGYEGNLNVIRYPISEISWRWVYGPGLEEKCTILKAMVVSQQAPPALKSFSADVLKEGSHVLSDVLTSKLSFFAFNSWYTVATFRQDPESTFGVARRCMFSTEIYRTDPHWAWVRRSIFSKAGMRKK